MESDTHKVTPSHTKMLHQRQRKHRCRRASQIPAQHRPVAVWKLLIANTETRIDLLRRARHLRPIHLNDHGHEAHQYCDTPFLRARPVEGVGTVLRSIEVEEVFCSVFSANEI